MSEGLPISSASVAAGTQQQGTSCDIGENLQVPMEGVLLGTVKGLAARNPKSLGGNSAAAFLEGIVHHLSSELKSLKDKLEKNEQKNSVITEELCHRRVREAQLFEQLKSAKLSTRVNQWTGIIGTALLGVALDTYKSNLFATSYVLGILGACILLLPIATTHLRRKE